MGGDRWECCQMQLGFFFSRESIIASHRLLLLVACIRYVVRTSYFQVLFILPPTMQHLSEMRRPVPSGLLMTNYIAVLATSQSTTLNDSICVEGLLTITWNRECLGMRFRLYAMNDITLTSRVIENKDERGSQGVVLR